MIINTEMIRVRKLDSREYLAIYGTQDNPYCRDYNLMDKNECEKMAVMLADLAGRLNEMVATMAAESLKPPVATAEAKSGCASVNGSPALVQSKNAPHC